MYTPKIFMYTPNSYYKCLCDEQSFIMAISVCLEAMEEHIDLLEHYSDAHSELIELYRKKVEENDFDNKRIHLKIREFFDIIHGKYKMIRYSNLAITKIVRIQDDV